ncbi:MAG TPA: DUF423 domain-containing protein [Puia sp.]|nr:DUF423 domain-containing protein [Puia sp.]
MNKFFVCFAALSGALSVMLGAFAAHQLKTTLPVEAVAIFETGVRYQFYHALALLISGLAYEKFSVKWIHAAGNCFITGIILFSGSLYALAFLRTNNDISAVKFIGPVTPLGGLFFIAGWLLLFFAALRKAGTGQQ